MDVAVVHFLPGAVANPVTVGSFCCMPSTGSRWAALTAAVALTACSVGASAPTGNSTGWELTVYYTAVETFHTDAKVHVVGCTTLNCSNGHDDLGMHPASFVQAVKDEGTGRLADGHYLNWSYDTGYWLDTAPRNSSGGALVPFMSAAADTSVLPQGTRFTITDCGHIEDNAKPPKAVCEKLSAAHWKIVDEFTPGLGGEHHLDLYIGEETQKDFTKTDWYITLSDAKLEVA